MNWRDRRVLVTGGHGFLGGYVVNALRRRGAIVAAPRRAEYDLVERSACARALAATGAEVVFHLAARVGGIGANRAAPGEFLYTNAVMGLHVLDACRVAGVAKVVIAGTVCAYPEHTPVPFREDELWNGYPEPTNAPYGIAKRLLVAQSVAYRAQYGLDSITVLPANLYGPRDDFTPATSHVIPAIICKCIEAREAGCAEVVLWGDGTATRDFLFVDDAAEGLVLAAEHHATSDPVNLGTGIETSIADVAARIAQASGFTGQFAWDRGQPNGQQRRALDVSRARGFGFAPRMTLGDGLAATIAWYRADRSRSES
jgi:GDP-L-fucose synthase